MRRYLRLWALRREERRLAEQVALFEEHAAFYRVQAKIAQRLHRRAQARLWVAEPSAQLLDPGRPVVGA